MSMQPLNAKLLMEVLTGKASEGEKYELDAWLGMKNEDLSAIDKMLLAARAVFECVDDDGPTLNDIPDDILEVVMNSCLWDVAHETVSVIEHNGVHTLTALTLDVTATADSLEKAVNNLIKRVQERTNQVQEWGGPIVGDIARMKIFLQQQESDWADKFECQLRSQSGIHQAHIEPEQ